VAVEAMECLGGNGYVEETPLARLFRESPLNGIWEGSANVICLDALRALGRSREAFDALAGEIAATPDARIAKRMQWVTRALADPASAERSARAIVESLALCVQGTLMKRHADASAAEAFCASRLDMGEGGRAFGTLAPTVDFAGIVRRATLTAGN
jgi:putative acyl-CoA dehydrogenase